MLNQKLLKIQSSLLVTVICTEIIFFRNSIVLTFLFVHRYLCINFELNVKKNFFYGKFHYGASDFSSNKEQFRIDICNLVFIFTFLAIYVAS